MERRTKKGAEKKIAIPRGHALEFQKVEDRRQNSKNEVKGEQGNFKKEKRERGEGENFRYSRAKKRILEIRKQKGMTRDF